MNKTFSVTYIFSIHFSNTANLLEQLDTILKVFLCFCDFLAFISSRISLALFVLVLFQCNIADVADETHLTGTLGFNTVNV